MKYGAESGCVRTFAWCSWRRITEKKLVALCLLGFFPLTLLLMIRVLNINVCIHWLQKLSCLFDKLSGILMLLL